MGAKHTRFAAISVSIAILGCTQPMTTNLSVLPQSAGTETPKVSLTPGIKKSPMPPTDDGGNTAPGTPSNTPGGGALSPSPALTPGNKPSSSPPSPTPTGVPIHTFGVSNAAINAISVETATKKMFSGHIYTIYSISPLSTATPSNYIHDSYLKATNTPNKYLSQSDSLGATYRYGRVKPQNIPITLRFGNNSINASLLADTDGNYSVTATLPSTAIGPFFIDPGGYYYLETSNDSNTHTVTATASVVPYIFQIVMEATSSVNMTVSDNLGKAVEGLTAQNVSFAYLAQILSNSPPETLCATVSTPVNFTDQGNGSYAFKIPVTITGFRTDPKGGKLEAILYILNAPGQSSSTFYRTGTH